SNSRKSPPVRRWRPQSAADLERTPMKPDPTPAGANLTLQDVLDRLVGAQLADTRRRDLRSAVASYAKLCARRPSATSLALPVFPRPPARLLQAEAYASARRWPNLRSPLASAIDASGILPMLKTAGLTLDPAWEKLLAGTPQQVRAGLSRF